MFKINLLIFVLFFSYLSVSADDCEHEFYGGERQEKEITETSERAETKWRRGSIEELRALAKHLRERKSGKSLKEYLIRRPKLSSVHNARVPKTNGIGWQSEEYSDRRVETKWRRDSIEKLRALAKHLRERKSGKSLKEYRIQRAKLSSVHNARVPKTNGIGWSPKSIQTEEQKLKSN